MAAEEVPSTGLGASMGRLAGANIVAITDILTALLNNRSIRPGQASVIMQRFAENAGAEYAAALQLRARYFAACSNPRKGKRKLR
jgi:hypothetical protein